MSRLANISYSICNNMTNKTITTFTDGGARGNPGPAGIGFVLKENGQTVFAKGEYIGKTTNNQAEYRALLRALEEAIRLGAMEVHCFLDSELLVKQLNYQYKVRDQDLAVHFVRAVQLSKNFKKITFIHIPREQNTEADTLVNEAIDRAL